MKYEDIKNPDELLEFMNQNIEYGFVGESGKIYNDGSTDEFQEGCIFDWRYKNGMRILGEKYGHCFDQTEFERMWFDQQGYKCKMIFVCFDDFGTQLPCHTYLVYESCNKWYWFEHSDFSVRGNHEYNSLGEAINSQLNHQIEYARLLCDITEADINKMHVIEYKNPIYGLTDKEFKVSIVENGVELVNNAKYR